jgi:ribose 5-phosphate isomerase A
LSDRDALKRDAAEAAAALVDSGMVVGIGTGSTAAFLIAALIARRVRDGLDIVCIPTSERSGDQAREGGLALTDFGAHRAIDITIDGADEILLPSLHLVKGLGGALLREKMVASASRRLVIIADEEKIVPQLGAHAPVPVEVTAFGLPLTHARLAALGAEPVLRMGADGAPYRTDNGNPIIDCRFARIDDAAALDRAMRDIVGVVETGLFIGLATEAFVAGAQGVVEYRAG